jgi:sec-independent protein translocase protein TatA
MISTPGPLELLLILGLALLVLGPNRLPDAARSAGKAVRDFRDALSEEHDPEDEFASADEDESIEAGPAAEAEYRERVAGDDEPEQDEAGEPEADKAEAAAAKAGPAGEAEYRERKSGSGTEAGDPAPPPIS